MAVIRSVPGLRVTIVNADGQSFTEHYKRGESSRPDEQKLVKTYIPAQELARFGVRIDVLPEYKFDSEFLAAYLSIDGSEVSKPLVFRSKWLAAGKTISRNIKGVNEISGATISQFQLTKISTTNEDEVTCIIDHTTIGTIKLVIYGARAKENPIVVLKQEKSSSVVLKNDRVTEKHLKDSPVTLRTRQVTSLSDPFAAIGGAKRFTVEHVAGNIPIATYVFHYLTHDALDTLSFIKEAPQISSADVNSEPEPDQSRKYGALEQLLAAVPTLPVRYFTNEERNQIEDYLENLKSPRENKRAEPENDSEVTKTKRVSGDGSHEDRQEDGGSNKKRKVKKLDYIDLTID